jgi:hypothetical protein
MPVRKAPTASRREAPNATVNQLNNELEIKDQKIAIQNKYFWKVTLNVVLVAMMPTP